MNLDSRLRWSFVVLAIWLAGSACGDSAETYPEFEIAVFAEGLVNPVGLAPLPTGGVLVAEEGTGRNDDSAGISLITGTDPGVSGRVDRVVSGLPSGQDSGDLSGVPLVGVSPDGTTVYTAHFGSEALLTFPLPNRKTIEAGIVLGPGDLRPVMKPLNQVRLTNPFDISFSSSELPVVTDASGNGVAIETGDGRTEFIHRFSQLRDPDQESVRIDPVPTGITSLGDEYLVTLTGGCPYPSGAGQLVAIDGQQTERVVADGLNMPIDVEIDQDGTIWILEFARFEPEASCFGGDGYLPGTGRLSRLDGDRVVPVIENLDFPGAVAAGADGSLYVSEVFAGRVLRLTPGQTPDQQTEEELDDEADRAVPGPDAPARRWHFDDVATAAGVDFQHGVFKTGISEDPVAMMGGGVCWLDADGDGDLDLYLVNSHALAEADIWSERGGLPTNRLYLNNDGQFTDRSAASGADLALRGNGCLAADLDGDNDVDLYVTTDGPNALLINDGTGRFTESASRAGVAAAGWSSAAAAADVNGDGVIDLFVGTYIDLERRIANPSGAFPQDYLGQPNHLFLGNGDGTFTDSSGPAGISNDDRTLGALFTDLDRDGDLDLYLTNDGQPNTLYENRSTATETHFVDVTKTAAVGDPGSGMGVAGGDYDGDGALDLMITNWEAELHALYRGSPADDLSFVYSTFRIGYSGLGSGKTGWGTALADFDNDTDLDLFIANGRVPVTDLAADAEPMQLLGNLTEEGEVGQLRDWGERSGLDRLGPKLARGAATADYDNDGDLDLAINQIGGPAVLLRNDDPPGRAITVIVDPPTPGTWVSARLSDGTIVERELHAGNSYLSTSDQRLHIGVGAGSIDSVNVRWPSGAERTVDGVEPNTAIVVTHP